MDTQNETLHLGIQTGLRETQSVQVNVYSQTGNPIFSKKETLRFDSGIGVMALATSGVSNGIYIIEIRIQTSGEQRVIRKKIAIFR
jgi:hypothetical protein